MTETNQFTKIISDLTNEDFIKALNDYSPETGMLPKLKRHRRSYYLSRSLKSLIQRVFNAAQVEQAIALLNKYVNHYLRTKDSVGGRKIAHLFHLLIDEKIAMQKNLQADLARQITCQKGCCHCCYQSVLITKDEAELILAYLAFYGIILNITKLEQQAQFDVHDWETKPASEKACVFLDEHGACRIYNFRPNNCRRLFALTEPAHCEGIIKNHARMFVIPEAEIISSAATSACRSGSLPKMLLECVNELTK